MASATARPAEPGWLAERRAQAVEAAKELQLARAEDPRLGVHRPLEARSQRLCAGRGRRARRRRPRRTRRSRSPRARPDLTQVDAVTRLDDVAAPGGEGRPDSVTVMSLSEGAERFPDLVGDRLGTIVPAGARSVRGDQRGRAGAAARSSTFPKNSRPEQPISLTAIQQAAGRTLNWRTLIVLEEGAEAEVWERYISADEDGDGLFNGVTELIVGAGANLRYVCGQDLSASSWIFASQRAEVAARRQPRMGRARLRLRPTARSGWRPSSRGRGAAREGHRRLRQQRPPAPRLRHHAGARGRGHDLRSRLPRRPRWPLDRRLARA